ncbi:MAG: histone deacetylase family protein [Bauldia litoralis]
MTTLLYTHSSSLDHDTGAGHPERVARIEAVNRALSSPSYGTLLRCEAPRVLSEQLTRVHEGRYVDLLLNNIPAEGYVRLDPDTVLSAGSGEAALRSAGAIVAAVDGVMAGMAANAFCAVRPPGHHAEPGRGMGFCLFNNVAVGAMHVRAAHGIGRIAIVDFDVHHGNGTQAVFENDPDLFYASTHQWPLYPGTGAPTETGVNRNIVNAVLPPMAGSAEFRSAIRDRVVPALENFQPDFLFISAGFDGHRDDPLAMLNLVEADYAWATRQLCAVAAGFAGGRVVSTLEGGYDLNALAASAKAHVEALAASSLAPV